jgi:hypothetical protein
VWDGPGNRVNGGEMTHRNSLVRGGLSSLTSSALLGSAYAVTRRNGLAASTVDETRRNGALLSGLR